MSSVSTSSSETLTSRPSRPCDEHAATAPHYSHGCANNGPQFFPYNGNSHARSSGVHGTTSRWVTQQGREATAVQRVLLCSLGNITHCHRASVFWRNANMWTSRQTGQKKKKKKCIYIHCVYINIKYFSMSLRYIRQSQRPTKSVCFVCDVKNFPLIGIDIKMMCS